jgi:hypothetical protein
VPIYDEKHIPRTDIDILLSDTEYCMAVEVKRRPDGDDVKRHIKRMALIRQYPPAEVKGKKLLGAMAGGEVDIDVREEAYNAGLFVLTLTGDLAALLPPPDGFIPKEW